jgi:hypothetical protein
MHADADVDRLVAGARARASRFRSELAVFGAREGFALRLS